MPSIPIESLGKYLLVFVLIAPGYICLHTYYGGKLRGAYKSREQPQEILQVFFLAVFVLGLAYLLSYWIMSVSITFGLKLTYVDVDAAASFFWINYHCPKGESAADAQAISALVFWVFSILVGYAAGALGQVLVYELLLDLRFPRFFEFRNSEYYDYTGRRYLLKLKGDEEISIILKTQNNWVGLLERFATNRKLGRLEKVELKILTKEQAELGDAGEAFLPLSISSSSIFLESTDLNGPLEVDYYVVNRQTRDYHRLRDS